jgi:DNA-binding NarL/FixJ family response regulator
MTIRILLVDDQPLLRRGFRMVLAAEPDMEVVGEAGDGDEAIRLTRALTPDVVLMDVRMPNKNGVQATRQIVASGSASKIIILTTFDIDEYAFDGLHAGASGFLLKDVLPEDLLAAIRTVAGGEAVIAPSTTRRLLDRFAQRFTSDTENTGRQHPLFRLLTDREQEVFLEIANGLTNAEIAAGLVLSEATVKTHVGHVLTKLGLRDRVQAVIFAYENEIVRSPG